jgi:hypothetical protein
MHRLNRSLAVVCLAMLVVTAGCSSTEHYQLTLWPEATGLDRELLCWQSSSSAPYRWEEFPAEKLAAIAKVYGVLPATKLDQKHSFRARFYGPLPNDVGGRGSYNVWNSPFGSAVSYLERFGGNDDLNAQIDVRRKAASHIVDHLIGWLAMELSHDPKWEDLRQYLDTTVRRDVENLSSLVLMESGSAEQFASSNSSDQEIDGAPLNTEDLWMRILQYLTERGYLEASDFPGLMRSLDGDDFAVPVFAHLIERQLGLAPDAPRPSSLAFLANNKSAIASLERYLRTTPEYQPLEQAWQEEKKTNPDASAPEPLTILFELFNTAFFEFKLFSDTTSLEIVLTLDDRPVATNGSWNAKKNEITWTTSINGAQGLPTFVYATWSWPAKEVQSARFGKVLLQGDSLYRFALWYRGLTDVETIEWNTFVAGLKPGAELPQQLEGFRFSTDPPLPTDENEPVPGSAADEAKQLISAALNTSD